MDKHHAAWLERHADRDGAWLKANTVPEIKLLVDKADAVIAYMRKAGNYDVDTVQEYKIKQCEAVVKGGRLLEKESPGQGARTDLTSSTTDRSYRSILQRAGLKKNTARLRTQAHRFQARAECQQMPKFVVDLAWPISGRRY